MSDIYHDKGNTRTMMSGQSFAEETDAIDDFRRVCDAFKKQMLDIQSRMATPTNCAFVQDIIEALPEDATATALRMRTALEEQKDG